MDLSDSLTSTDWPDADLHHTVVGYILGRSTNLHQWQWTVVGSAHQQTMTEFEFLSGELPIVSFRRLPESWYLLTTRRVLASYSGESIDKSISGNQEHRSGNFKKREAPQIEEMSVSFVDEPHIVMEYETGAAAMVPIYYFRFWWLKFPIFHKLDPASRYWTKREHESQSES